MKSKTIDLTKKITYSAVLLALCMVLPLLTGQIPEIGKTLCPMHLPVLLCGFICGPFYGLIIGFIAPLLRFLIFQMPPIIPSGLGMAFELATYGFISGVFYKLFPKKMPFIYLSLIIAMIIGRGVWGIARCLLSFITDKQFTFAMFLAGAFKDAISGIIVQIVLIPLIIEALNRSKLFYITEKSFKQAVYEQIKKYPKITAVDLYKIAYQSAFGGVHFAKSGGGDIERLKAEIASLPKDGYSFVEELGGKYVRYYLSSNDLDILDKISNVFQNERKELKKILFIHKLHLLKVMAKKDKLPCSLQELSIELKKMKSQGYPPVSHSDIYKREYRTVYRVLPKKELENILSEKN